MPKVAISLGAAMDILPLDKISKKVTEHFRKTIRIKSKRNNNS
jgi:chemotaxis response regulator CheB